MRDPVLNTAEDSDTWVFIHAVHVAL